MAEVKRRVCDICPRQSVLAVATLTLTNGRRGGKRVADVCTSCAARIYQAFLARHRVARQPVAVRAKPKATRKRLSADNIQTSLLNQRGQFTAARVADKLGVSRWSVQQAARQLIRENRLVAIGTKRGRLLQAKGAE